jgi:hypothetical protein
LVVKAVNDFRVMRQDQVQRLLFPSKETATVRLRKLWEHAYLKREWLPSVGGIQTSHILYLVDRRGADLLKAEFGYDEETLRWSAKKPSYIFMEHTLGLSEVRLAVELSCRDNGLTMKVWRDEKAIKADYDRVKVGREWVAVLPDAYFTVQVPRGTLHFFVEFDRGTEGLKVFRKKVAAYLDYFRSGKCRTRFGTDRIRVLTVTEGGATRLGKTRIGNLKTTAEDQKARSRFWFSTLPQVVSEDMLTAPIWQVATRTDATALT